MVDSCQNHNSIPSGQYREYTLGKTAQDYVYRRLKDSGLSLSRCLLENLDRDRVTIRTFLPTASKKEALTCFEYGNIAACRITESWLYNQVAVYLSKEKQGLLVFEDNCARRNDECIQRSVLSGEPSLCFFGDEVYYAVSGTNFTIDKIDAARRAAESAWVLIGVLTVGWPQCHLLDDLREMKQDDISRLARATQMIIVSAFDGEAYIIAEWH